MKNSLTVLSVDAGINFLFRFTLVTLLGVSLCLSLLEIVRFLQLFQLR